VSRQPDDRKAPSPVAHHPVLQQAGSVVFAARGGFQLIGGGHVVSSCTRDGGPCLEGGEENFAERSYVMLGVEALLHLTPGLRLGAGYELLPYSAVKVDGDDEAFHLGHEHALGAIVETLVPVGSKLALALRAQGGLRLLVLGGDIAEGSDQLLQRCRDTRVARCAVDRGPLLGSTLGGMLGVVGGAKLRWRVDLAVQHVVLKLPSSSAENGPFDQVARSATLYDTRSWLLGGIEL
jgi:hypothetical protein